MIRITLFIILICTFSDSTFSEQEYSPYIEALFTEGVTDSPDPALGERLRQLTREAPPGSYIRFSLFLMFYKDYDEPLVRDLIAAAERGVNVQLLVNFPESYQEDNLRLSEPYYRMLRDRLQQASEKGQSDSWVMRHALIKDQVKDHNKTFLFSESDGQTYWAIVTSENLTDAARQKHQAGVVIRDKEIYQQLVSYWFDIKEGSFNGNQYLPQDKSVSAILFPQESGEDSIYAALDKMSVEPGQASQGLIRVSMPRWSYERVPLAFKLVDLAKKGYQVEVITRRNSRIVDDVIRKVLADKKNVKLMAIDVGQLNIHSKYILFNGFYNEEESQIPQKIVWTGSHNFTGMALRDNYEVILQIKDDRLFDSYNNNFEKLKLIIGNLE